jgi:HSP20 family protein
MAIQVRRPDMAMQWATGKEIERIDRLLNHPFNQLLQSLPQDKLMWTPVMEILEKDDSYIVRFELPGIKQEDVDISVIDNILTIKGERTANSEIKENHYQYCEVYYGSFERSITLPKSVDEKKLVPNYDNGILEISFPKMTSAKATRVPVKAKR